MMVPNSPKPITDIFLQILDKAPKARLKGPPDSNVEWETLMEGDVPLNLNEKGKPICLLSTRAQNQSPITAITVSKSREPLSPGWFVLPVNLNEGTSGRALYLQYRRDAGASPIITISYSTKRLMPENLRAYFGVDHEVNHTVKCRAVYLTFALGDLAAGCWEPLALAEASEVRSRDLQPVAGGAGPAPSKPRDLKALQVVSEKAGRSEISIELEGYYPLQHIKVADVGESTFLLTPKPGPRGGRLL